MSMNAPLQIALRFLQSEEDLEQLVTRAVEKAVKMAGPSQPSREDLALSVSCYCRSL